MSGRENLRHVVIEPKLLDVKHWDALKAQGWPASHPGQARLMSRCVSA